MVSSYLLVYRRRWPMLALSGLAMFATAEGDGGAGHGSGQGSGGRVKCSGDEGSR